jgi:hypothetical protein
MRVVGSWEQITQNTDGSPIVDLAYYEVNWRVNSSPWQSTLVPASMTSVLLGIYPVGPVVSLRVAGIDQSGNPGAYAVAGDMTLDPSATPLAPPSTPVTDQNTAGILRVSWDGKDNAGVLMPPSLLRVDVHVSTSNGFSPTAATYTGESLYAAGAAALAGLAYDTPYYVRLVAVNQDLVASAPSAQAVGSVRRGVDADFENVNVGKLIAGRMIATYVELGGRLTTAAGGVQTGARLELDGAGLRVYKSNGVDRSITLAADGSATFSGDIVGANISASTLPSSLYTTNAVRNSQFEDVNTTGDALNWNYQTLPSGGRIVGAGLLSGGSTGSAWQVDLDTVAPISGTKSLRLRTTAGNSGSSAATDPVNVVAGERWDVTVDVKTQKAATGGEYRPIFCRLRFYDATGTKVTTTPPIPINTLFTYMNGKIIIDSPNAVRAGEADIASNFTPFGAGPFRLVGTVEVPDNAVTMRLIFYTWTGTSTNTTTTDVWIDNVTIRRSPTGQHVRSGTITGSTIRTAEDGVRIAMEPNNQIDAGATLSGEPMPALIFYPSFVPWSYATHPRITGRETTGWAVSTDKLNMLRMAGGVSKLSATEVSNGTPYRENAIQIWPRNYSEEQNNSGFAHNAGIDLDLWTGDSSGNLANITLNVGLRWDSVGASVYTAQIGTTVNNIALEFYSGELRVAGFYGTYSTIAAAAFAVRTSSRDTKRNIKVLDFDPVEAVKAARVSRFQHKKGYVADPDRWRIGPMVEDLPAEVRSIGGRSGPNDLPNAHDGYDIVSVVGVLWGAVGALTDRVEALEAKS